MLNVLLSQKNVIRIAGAHDGLTARIAEQVGYDAIWSSSLCISASYGVPDMSIITMTDMLERAAMMRDVVSIPIIADCDSGFGNVYNAVRTTALHCRSGIDAVCIEDKLFPKSNSYLPVKQELRTTEEYVEIIKACKDVGAKFDNFFYIARLEGFVAGCSLPEVIDRAYAYSEAGADGLFIQSKRKDMEEICAFMKHFNTDKPIFIVPTSYPQITVAEVSKLGIKGIIYANQSMRAAVKAEISIMKKILEDETAVNVEQDMVSMKEIFKLQGIDYNGNYKENL